jgi:hypothetical protein
MGPGTLLGPEETGRLRLWVSVSSGRLEGSCRVGGGFRACGIISAVIPHPVVGVGGGGVVFVRVLRTA